MTNKVLRRHSPAEVLAAVTELAPLIRENAAESERLTRPTEAVVRALDDAGVFRIGIPEELGGYDFGVREQVEIFMRIARADGSAGWGAVGATLPSLCTAFPEETVDELREQEWVGPLVAATVFDSSNGRAEPVEGGWMVSGKWGFASNIQLAGWFLGGVNIVGSDGAEGRGVALLRREQYEIKDDWHVMGLAATNSNTVVVAEPVFVPARHTVSTQALTEQASNSQRRYAPAAAIVPLILSLAVGIARGTLDEFVQQARKRKPMGLAYASLATTPSAQVTAAKVDAEIRAAEMVVRSEADRIDASSSQDFGTYDMNAAFVLAGSISRRCSELIDLLQWTIGGSTAALSNPIQRAVRDIHVLNTHYNMRLDVHAENHGAELLDPDVPRSTSLTL